MANDFNPYSAPQAPAQNPYVVEGTGLKSLGQEARKASLNKARWIMLILGVINLGLSIFAYVNVQNELKQLANRGMVADPGELRFVLGSIYASIAIGVIYIVMGIFVYTYPVPITIAALVLYIGVQIVNAALSPNTIHHGWLIKVLVIAGLWSALKAAQAYERERRLAPYM